MIDLSPLNGSPVAIVIGLMFVGLAGFCFWVVFTMIRDMRREAKL